LRSFWLRKYRRFCIFLRRVLLHSLSCTASVRGHQKRGQGEPNPLGFEI